MLHPLQNLFCFLLVHTIIPERIPAT